MKKSVVELRKVTLNVPVVIYNQLVERCKKYGTNTTNEMLSLIRQGLQQQEAMEYLPEVLKQLADLKSKKKKVAEKLSTTKLKAPRS